MNKALRFGGNVQLLTFGCGRREAAHFDGRQINEHAMVDGQDIQFEMPCRSPRYEVNHRMVG